MEKINQVLEKFKDDDDVIRLKKRCFKNMGYQIDEFEPCR